VKLFSESRAKVLREYKAHAESVNAVSFHPQGLRFVSGSSDGILRVWDIAETDEKIERKIFDSPITFLSFDSNGKYLVASSAKNGIKIFTFDDELEEIIVINDHIDKINSVQFNSMHLILFRHPQIRQHCYIQLI
jgi:WD40 repeat protein